nr:hypothetical protein [Tanacetum cinerariifolium]
MFMNCSTIISLHRLKHQSNHLGCHVQNDAMLHSVSKACSHLYNVSSLLSVLKVCEIS